MKFQKRISNMNFKNAFQKINCKNELQKMNFKNVLQTWASKHELQKRTSKMNFQNALQKINCQSELQKMSFKNVLQHELPNMNFKNELQKMNFKKWTSKNELQSMSFKKWTSKNELQNMSSKEWTISTQQIQNMSFKNEVQKHGAAASFWEPPRIWKPSNRTLVSLSSSLIVVWFCCALWCTAVISFFYLDHSFSHFYRKTHPSLTFTASATPKGREEKKTRPSPPWEPRDGG